MPPAPRAEPKRRRRSREEAEREILEAAAALLRERPLHGVSVSAIMEQTTLSRKSFYVYFRDRYDLLTRLFRPLRQELDQANERFVERPTGDPFTGVTLAAGHAALPISWNSSSLALQAGTAEPSKTLPSGAAKRNLSTADGFAPGSPGFL